eukprot:1160141-Pelagomonas_calceolata.AAC.4
MVGCGGARAGCCRLGLIGWVSSDGLHTMGGWRAVRRRGHVDAGAHSRVHVRRMCAGSPWCRCACVRCRPCCGRVRGMSRWRSILRSQGGLLGVGGNDWPVQVGAVSQGRCILCPRGGGGFGEGW